MLSLVRLRNYAFLVFVTMSLSAFAADVALTRDIVFGRGGDVELRLDLARPVEASEPAPCVVVIHGGAWRSGNKSLHINEIRRFAEQGYVSATIQYRLCPKHCFPAQIEDVKCAVRFLRANAKKYGIDPKRIGAIGFSAGAHLSMMLGTMDPQDGFEGDGGWADQSSKVQAVVSFFGPTELAGEDLPERSVSLVNAFIGGTKADMMQAFKDASPITYVDSGDAPMLLLQGTEDPLVPHTQAIKMVDLMTEANVPGRVELIIDVSHGWGGQELQRTIEVSNQFFRRYLRGDENWTDSPK
ncbi:MAG: alpha/beta hydrolase [Planctomycetota bacterium]